MTGPPRENRFRDHRSPASADSHQVMLTRSHQLTSVNDLFEMKSPARVALAVTLAAFAAAFSGCARDSAPPPPPPGAIPAGQSLRGAAIRGRVTFEWKAPPRNASSMTAKTASPKPGATTLTDDTLVA